LCLVLKPVAHALLEYYAKQRGTGTSDIHVALTVFAVYYIIDVTVGGRLAIVQYML